MEVSDGSAGSLGSRYEELEARKTLKDRLDYPFILTRAVLAYIENLPRMENDDETMREVIMALVGTIPQQLWDKKFKAQYNAARIQKAIDQRPQFCGVPASTEFCQDHNIKPYVLEESFDYYKLYAAAISLLERLHLLTRRNYTERFTGKKAHKKAKDIEPDELEEMDEG